MDAKCDHWCTTLGLAWPCPGHVALFPATAGNGLSILNSVTALLRSVGVLRGLSSCSPVINVWFRLRLLDVVSASHFDHALSSTAVTSGISLPNADAKSIWCSC